MSLLKRTLIVAAVAASFGVVGASQADAGVVFRRVAPVRRVAARAVLPPYPVARRAAFVPVYRPVNRGFIGPAYFGPRPGVAVSIGF